MRCFYWGYNHMSECVSPSLASRNPFPAQCFARLSHSVYVQVTPISVRRRARRRDWMIRKKEKRKLIRRERSLGEKEDWESRKELAKQQKRKRKTREIFAIPRQTLAKLIRQIRSAAACSRNWGKVAKVDARHANRLGHKKATAKRYHREEQNRKNRID